MFWGKIFANNDETIHIKYDILQKLQKYPRKQKKKNALYLCQI